MIEFLLFSLLAYGQQKEEIKFQELERAAFKTVSIHCGACHIPSKSTGNPRALKIFNLNAGLSWYKSMSTGQLFKSEKMLMARRIATAAELEENFGGTKERPRAPSDEEVANYSAFVQQATMPIFRK